MRTFFFVFCAHTHTSGQQHTPRGGVRRRASDLSRARLRIPITTACFRVLGGSRFAHSHAKRVVWGTFFWVPGYSKFTEKTAPDTSSWLKWVYYYIFIYNGKWMCIWGDPKLSRVTSNVPKHVFVVPWAPPS